MTMPTSPAGKAPNSQRGFTYAAVLAALVIVGIATEIAYLSTARMAQADREAELLFRGLAYRRAIEHFYRAHGSYPRALEDLLEDPRSPSGRHIRALYGDPVTGGGEWTLIPASDGGIGGVASRSNEKPLKTANFPLALETFADAGAYSGWVFEFDARASAHGKTSGP